MKKIKKIKRFRISKYANALFLILNFIFIYFICIINDFLYIIIYNIKILS